MPIAVGIAVGNTTVTVDGIASVRRAEDSPGAATARVVQVSDRIRERSIRIY